MVRKVLRSSQNLSPSFPYPSTTLQVAFFGTMRFLGLRHCNTTTISAGKACDFEIPALAICNCDCVGPDLFLFQKKTERQGETPKKYDCLPCQTPEIPGKEGKMCLKMQGDPRKKQGNQQKTRKKRLGQDPTHTHIWHRFRNARLIIDY